MKTKRKRLLIIVSVTICITLTAAVMLTYHPKRNIVIEVEGTPNRNFAAVFVVDGQRQTQTVTLPKTFTFHARDVSYRVDPLDRDADDEITGHISGDGFGGSCTGWSIGGSISCSNVLGMWGSMGIMTYKKDHPGPEVTTR